MTLPRGRKKGCGSQTVCCQDKVAGDGKVFKLAREIRRILGAKPLKCGPL